MQNNLPQITTDIISKRKLFIKNLINNFASNNAIDIPAENKTAKAFAPSNIALVKYWGKSDLVLNQPTNDSLSISLDNLGAQTSITLKANKSNQTSEFCHDKIYLNDDLVDTDSEFFIRLNKFLDLFRPNSDYYFIIKTSLNIPMGCGVASSACGFAALTLALDKLFAWYLPKDKLAQIAQIGSGSAARSIFAGFVHWRTDSSIYKLDNLWPELRVGLCIVTSKQKKIGSTEAMIRSQNTAPDYDKWPTYAQSLISPIINSIKNKDFTKFGEISEQCAIKMHDIIRSCSPSINYDLDKTCALKEKVKNLRESGLEVYFTQDAGPNLKLLFLSDNLDQVLENFPDLQVITP
jgi:diphosphomevalonate decarboxylase